MNRVKRLSFITDPWRCPTASQRNTSCWRLQAAAEQLLNLSILYEPSPRPTGTGARSNTCYEEFENLETAIAQFTISSAQDFPRRPSPLSSTVVSCHRDSWHCLRSRRVFRVVLVTLGSRKALPSREAPDDGLEVRPSVSTLPDAATINLILASVGV